ncbi:dolichol-phosphate mannose synthase subunit 3-like [Cynara cardunculus var. scolymus]|uniref:dolichol-phosphate mannose synthase subunit 3-like n=1 Tax=Cynara cardunculus var. scolymus TaxID=59895 RepID=UPI000D6313CC|nr:dolichol-phosphate mannose synthase subunit 3-like [Cynara cardunculus var. scolymus]XP_024974530.1 dolichol-phosphate mannose synthase subunit 3-like [Cynara cardunculus var. scolymus]
MKHIVKILTFLVAITATWISLLQAAMIPRSHTWLLPLYLVVSLGCYGLFMVGFGLMQFPTCPQEAVLLQQDVIEVKQFLKRKGVDVGSD